MTSINDSIVRDSLRDMLNARQEQRTTAHKNSGRNRTGRVAHSWAGNCSRRIAYDVRYRDAEIAAAGDPEALALAKAEYGPDEDAIDEVSLWTFWMGDTIHDTIQQAVTRALAGDDTLSVIHEDDCSIGDFTSGRFDTYIFDGTNHTVIEFKSINGYGFKAMTTGARSGEKGEGPKLNNLLQLGLNMMGVAERVGVPIHEMRGVLAYISKESNNFVRSTDPLDKIVAEYHYTWDEIKHLVDPEVARLHGIIGKVDNGDTTTVKRSIPAYGPGQITSITDKGGSYASVDGRVLSAWECRYCPFATRCKADG